MSGAKLVTIADGVEIFTTSAVDARFLYKEIFTFNGYGELRLPSEALVIDVGANIGMFLLRVKTDAPDAEVWAFEPMPALAEIVRRNVDLHGFADVTLHQVALGEAARSDAMFTYYPLLPSSSTRYPQRQDRLKEVMGSSFPARVLERMYQGQQVAVEVRRLSDYLADARTVDLLKVDTSGSELEVLAGIDDEHWPLFRRVVLDVQDQDDRLATICAVLAEHGLSAAVRPAPMADGDGLNFQIHAVRDGV